MYWLKDLTVFTVFAIYVIMISLLMLKLVTCVFFFLISLARGLCLLLSFFKGPAFVFTDFLHFSGHFSLIRSALYYFFFSASFEFTCSFFLIFFKGKVRLLFGDRSLFLA